MVNVNFFINNKFALLVFCISISNLVFTVGPRKKTGKHIKSKSNVQIFETIRESQNKEKNFTDLFNLLCDELNESQKRSEILGILHECSTKNFLTKDPYSYVFAGYIVYLSLQAKNYSSPNLKSVFSQLNKLIQGSKIFLQNDAIYVNSSMIKDENIEIFNFLLKENITFHIEGGIDNLYVMGAKEGSSKIVQLCINNDYHRSEKFNVTPLMHAATRGHLNVIKVLSDYYSKVNEEDNMGRTALVYAVEWGQTEVVEWLLSQNARITCDAFMSACFQGYDDILELLINKLTKVNFVDLNNNTPLMILAKNGNKKMIKRILRKDSSINAKNDHGKTALSQAVLCGHLPAVRLLLRKGAKIKALRKLRTEIVSLFNPDSEMLNLLREEGFNSW